MRSLRLFLFAVIMLAACGSDPGPSVAGSADDTASSDNATSVPGSEVPPDTSDTGDTGEASGAAFDGEQERIKLNDARDRWVDGAMSDYTFTYLLQCECWQGPYTVEVVGGALHNFTTVEENPEPTPPYATVEAVFDEIEATLDEGRLPVEVSYDPVTGVPANYVYNGPELAVDGGFVFVLQGFELGGDEEPDGETDGEETDGEGETGGEEQAGGLVEAKQRWLDAGLTNYDYTFFVGCFCIANGPFDVQVRDGEIVSITAPADQEVDDDLLAEIVPSIDELFAILEEAQPTAAEFRAEFDAELGYPVDAYVDYDERIADDEFSYQVEIFPIAAN